MAAAVEMGEQGGHQSGGTRGRSTPNVTSANRERIFSKTGLWPRCTRSGGGGAVLRVIKVKKKAEAARLTCTCRHLINDA